MRTDLGQRRLAGFLLLGALVCCAEAAPAVAAPAKKMSSAQSSAQLYGNDRKHIDELLLGGRFKDQCTDDAPDVLSDIRTKKRVRYSINSTKGRERLAQLARAIHAMRYVDQLITQGNLPGGGYQVFRVVHGVPEVEACLNRGSAQTITDRFACDATLQKWLNNHRCVHGPGVHDDGTIKPELFLLWHRAYLVSFEASVRSMLTLLGDADAKAFAVPYWDWIEHPSVFDEFRCLSPQCSAGQLQPGGVPAPLYDDKRSSAANDGNKVVLDAQYTMLDSFDDWNGFSKELRTGFHNAIHNNVALSNGLDMAISEYAVEDPLFWVHHSFVDRLLVDWSRRHGSLQKNTSFGVALRRKWNDDHYSFPIWNGCSRVRYSPKFDELDFLGSESAMGVEYDPRTIDEGGVPSFAFDERELPVTSVAAKAAMFSDAVLGVNFSTPVQVQDKGAVFEITLSWVALLNLKAAVENGFLATLHGRGLRLDLDVELPSTGATTSHPSGGQFRIYVVPEVPASQLNQSARPYYVGMLSWFGDTDATFDVTEAVQRFVSDPRASLYKRFRSGVKLKIILVNAGYSPQPTSGYLIKGLTLH